ncbi:MAG TPA: adenosine kinase [Chthonomonadaceae bacterium]|nr:adenosine kinase [Chthonomonadaceae bacterium]
MRYDVFGMCNPLYDIQAEVPESVLAELDVQKGGMFLIDADQQKRMVSRIYDHIVNAESGGSGANTMIGLSLLGGRACYAGKIGNDEHGALYSESLRAKDVAVSVKSGDGTTGICLVLITPDTERTLCTYLGICRELGPEDLDIEAIRSSAYLYVTGYLWDTDSQKAAVLRAMREANAAGVKVALSLSDPFCVDRHKADFLEITAKYVDLLIGNHEEAQELVDASDPYDAIRVTAPLCDMAVVTMGSRGALLRQGDRVIEAAARRISPVDTTGAGDMYAAGLLYGLTHGIPLEKTAELASYVAAEVVAKLGPRLESVDPAVVEGILG